MPKKSKIIEFPHLRALLGQDDANRAEDAAGKQASDSAPEPEGEKKSIWQELRDIELPTALQSKEVMLCTVAVLMTLAVIVFYPCGCSCFFFSPSIFCTVRFLCGWILRTALLGNCR